VLALFLRNVYNRPHIIDLLKKYGNNPAPGGVLAAGDGDESIYARVLIKHIFSSLKRGEVWEGTKDGKT